MSIAAARVQAREAANLFGDLFAVLGNVKIVMFDCGTARGVKIRALEQTERARGSRWARRAHRAQV